MKHNTSRILLVVMAAGVASMMTAGTAWSGDAPVKPNRVYNAAAVARDDRQIAIDQERLAKANESGNRDQIMKARKKLRDDRAKRMRDAGRVHYVNPGNVIPNQ